MAKKIIWSENSQNDLFEILDYWFQTLGTKKYPAKLNTEIQKTIKLIKIFPEIGRKYEKLEIRFLVKDNYQIFYDFNETEIHILHIWNSRRDKNDMTFQR